MRALLVVEFKIAPDAAACFTGGAVFMEIDLLVFEASPKTLREDIVEGSSPAIHADTNLPSLKNPDVARAREVAALVGVDDLGRRLVQGSLERIEDKGLLKALIQLPTHHIS